ncbi:cytochrome P450 [Boletus reticuloceps]|uniref:Cytochrome P450 n=1 Tax=Boletus reticuloceps TaxID=495285 RepID=A0A8I2Z3G6_9AGAM|nr:cytochrome P450 [Boletus reticuloceps]
MSLTYEDGVGITGSVLPWAYLAGAAAAATALVLLSKRLLWSPTHKHGISLPPGPPATWFWESPMPKMHVAHGLTALVERYGPVISLRRGSHVTIVIGRMDAASEIMEKEGGALVDRPHLISAADIFSRGMRLLLEPTGDRFRRLRRAAHTHLQPKAAQTYEEIQAETAKDVILDVLNDPKRHMLHAQRYATSVILRVTYGKTSPTSNDDPEMVRIRQVLANFETALRPEAYLVDRIPWLKYVPGYGRQLKEFHRYELALFRDQLNRVRDDMATSNAGPSFGKTLLEHLDVHRLSDDEMAYLAGGLLGAGSDTTASGIIMMIMVAVCHPEAQARVQAELDEVVGKDRMPTFEDWNMLPQLHAFMLEALRWRPVAPLGMFPVLTLAELKQRKGSIYAYMPGFAHRATKDIIWRGQCIPAGATVVGCHWAISRDPEVFPDPETFNPRRWLTEDGRVRTDMHFYTYGFGRRYVARSSSPSSLNLIAERWISNRVCPGQHVANRSLYINLALLLWSFRISERPEAPIDIGPSGFRDAIVFHPKPFEAEFTPRVEEEWLRELMA